MTEINEILFRISSAWDKEDREQFKSLVRAAFYNKANKHEILTVLGSNQINVSEAFEEWAYMFIATEGLNDCVPG